MALARSYELSSAHCRPKYHKSVVYIRGFENETVGVRFEAVLPVSTEWLMISKGIDERWLSVTI